MTSLLRKGPLVLALALVALVATGSPAQGHALLIRSDPAQDARLFEPPATVTGWFSEPLEAGVSSLKVVDASGARVDLGDTQIDPGDPTKMTVSLRKVLGPGFYLVTWETLSRIDGPSVSDPTSSPSSTRTALCRPSLLSAMLTAETRLTSRGPSQRRSASSAK